GVRDKGVLGRSRRVGSIQESSAIDLSARAVGSALLRYAPRRASNRALLTMNLGKGTGGWP
ncbi:MAG: hypothetical protein ABSD90_00455, partial [Methylocystis sp.]